MKRKLSLHAKKIAETQDLDKCSVLSDGYEAAASEASFGSNSQRHCEATNEDQFLVIHVHEARHLTIKDYDTNSSDPFVKITVGGSSRKTRVIYRNCHPLWEQQLVFPLDGISEGEPLLVELYDRDFNKAKEFLGQVVMTLGKALEIAQNAEMGQNYWFGLSKKRSTDIISGELCLGFRVLDALAYINLAAELDAQTDQEHIATCLAGKALHLQLRGLNGLRASGLINTAALAASGASSTSGLTGQLQGQQQGQGQGQCNAGKLRVAKGLSLFLKFGRLTMEKPLPPLPSEDESCGGDDFELTVNEEVVIPLAAAMRTTPLAPRRKDELCDVKLYIKSTGSNTTIAKTQIPIWDIPIVDSSNSTADSPLSENSSSGDVTEPSPAAAAAAAATAAANTAVASQPLSGRRTPEGPLSSRSTQEVAVTGAAAAAAAPGTKALLDRRGLAGFGGLRVSTDGGSSESGPSTPRGRLGTAAEFLLASCKGAAAALSSPRTQSPAETPTLSTAPTAPAPGLTSSSDYLQRSKSDAACVLGLNSKCPLQLSGHAGSNSSGSSKGLFVEGSLHSVTACQRSQANYIMGKRRPGGLTGLSEFNDNIKSAVKSILVPPCEISRVGWAPTQEDGNEIKASNSGLKQYCRIMESYVPTRAHLEIGVGLEVVPLQLAVTPSGGASSMEETGQGGDSLPGTVSDMYMDDDDDEDVPDATPITLPEPYELVLQDQVVHIGVNSLHALLLGSQSELMASHYASEGLLDMVVGPWKPGGGEVCLRSRQVSYTKKLNIPVPLAPKECQVWEEHRLLMKQDGGFVAQHICTNNAPKGDCFAAKIQLCGVYVSSGTSRLRISMQLDWHKNTFGKGLVQTGAEADAKRGWARLMVSLQQHIRSKRGGLVMSNGGAVSLSQPAAVTAAMGGSNASYEAGPAGSSGSGVSGIGGKLEMQLLSAGFVLVVVLLLLLVVLVWKGASGISHELHELNDVLKSITNASRCSGLAGEGNVDL